MTKIGAPAAITALTVALAISACSSNANSVEHQTNPSVVSEAKAAVAAAMEPAQHSGPSDTPAPPRHKKLAIIEWGASASAVADAARGAQDAATALGWSTKTYDGNFLPATQNNAILDAVSQRFDAIFTIAVNTADIGSGMRAANAAHIPVIDYAGDNPIGTDDADVYGWVDGGNATGGKTLADYVIAKSDGKAKVGILYTQDFKSTQRRYSAFVAELAKCAGCSVAVSQSYASSSATQDLALQTTSMLSAHPDTQYLFVDIAQFATIAAKALAGQFETGVLGFDCNPANFSNIRRGRNEVACWGSSAYAAGWAGVDQAVRALTGARQSPEEIAPVRLFDSSNLPANDSWSGDFDPAVIYTKRWKITNG